QCSKGRLHTALEIEVVVDFLDGGLVGEAVEELERPDAGFHRVRPRDGPRNVGGHFHLGCILGARRYAHGYSQQSDYDRQRISMVHDGNSSNVATTANATSRLPQELHIPIISKSGLPLNWTMGQQSSVCHIST